MMDDGIKWHIETQSYDFNMDNDLLKSGSINCLWTIKSSREERMKQTKTLKKSS